MVDKSGHHFRGGALTPCRRSQDIAVAHTMPVQVGVEHADQFARLLAAEGNNREAIALIPF